jgi:hypothetical protein
MKTDVVPLDFWNRCRSLGLSPSRWLVSVEIGNQTLSVFETSCGAHGVARPTTLGLTVASNRYSGCNQYHFVKQFCCSTSRFGIGQTEGSNCTPLGLHRIAEKIGGGWPAGTVFKARRPIGYTWKGMPEAKITTRILWLEGLEPGFNRGGNVDSHARYIYIHGTGDQTTISKPSSCGCIHLADADLIPLFEKLPSGTLVWIAR